MYQSLNQSSSQLLNQLMNQSMYQALNQSVESAVVSVVESAVGSAGGLVSELPLNVSGRATIFFPIISSSLSISNYAVLSSWTSEPVPVDEYGAWAAHTRIMPS